MAQEQLALQQAEAERVQAGELAALAQETLALQQAAAAALTEESINPPAETPSFDEPEGDVEKEVPALPPLDGSAQPLTPTTPPSKFGMVQVIGVATGAIGAVAAVFIFLL